MLVSLSCKCFGKVFLNSPYDNIWSIRRYFHSECLQRHAEACRGIQENKNVSRLLSSKGKKWGVNSSDTKAHNPYVHIRSKGHFQLSLNIIISTVIRPSCLLISQDVPSYPHPPIFARTLYHTLVEMMVVVIQPGNSWNGNEGFR